MPIIRGQFVYPVRLGTGEPEKHGAAAWWQQKKVVAKSFMEFDSPVMRKEHNALPGCTVAGIYFINVEF